MEENAAMLNELCQRAAKRHITLYSRFLNLAQQREGEIAARRAGAEYCLYGGAQDCERRMLAVSGEDVPDESLFPIACLLAAPRSARFAAPIAHRVLFARALCRLAARMCAVSAPSRPRARCVKRARCGCRYPHPGWTPSRRICFISAGATRSSCSVRAE